MTLDLAIVIPVGPNDESWRKLLPQLAAWPVRDIVMVFPEQMAPAEPRPELIDPRVQVILAPRGRALQLNAGARVSTTRWLWFLHADSVLGDSALSAVTQHIDGPDRALGYFDLRFLDDGPAWMVINSIGAWIRSRLLGMPFGDQGFLVSRVLFDQLHGFDAAVTVGEDHDLVWRARHAGAAIQPVRADLFTSARKYSRQGWFRTTIEHLRATGRQAREFSRKGPR